MPSSDEGSYDYDAHLMEMIEIAEIAEAEFGEDDGES